MHIKINLPQNYINITLAFLIFINLKKTQKNPGGFGFFKKTQVFSSPDPKAFSFSLLACYVVGM